MAAAQTAAMASHRGYQEDRTAVGGDGGGTGGGRLETQHHYHGGTQSVCAVTEIPEKNMVPLTDDTTQPTAATTTTTSPGLRRSPKTARIADAKRGTGPTELVVHYTVPPGTRYLPTSIGHTVTMIHIGQHDDAHVYEPINTWLQSPEDGLRYHRSMNEDDVHNGPLDLATFGRPVVGLISDDRRWLINPLSYDPTRSKLADNYI